MKKIIGGILIVGVIISLVALLTVPFAAHFENQRQLYEYDRTIVHIVDKGDTLWTIVQNYMTEAHDIRKVIQEVRDINGITPEIFPGQQIEIPLYKYGFTNRQ